MSFRTGATVDTLDADWDEVKREVEDMGVPPAAIEQNRAFIQKWLRDAVEAGAMDEDPTLAGEGIVIEDSHISPNISSTPHAGAAAESSQVDHAFDPDIVDTAGTNAAQELTLLGDPREEKSSRQLSSTDGEGGTEPMTVASSAPTLYYPTDHSSGHMEEASASRLRINNQILHDKWVQYRQERGEEPDIPPSLTPRTKRRKSSPFSSLIFKLFSSNQKIIQAASDGDPEEVSRLLGLGVQVNTKDRWGWTAMSMAAYGGHEEVARVLISHRASLDHRDVDDDTPLTLALNKGHRNLVLMIEEEMTRRAIEAEAKDQPRLKKQKTLMASVGIDGLTLLKSGSG